MFARCTNYVAVYDLQSSLVHTLFSYNPSTSENNTLHFEGNFCCPFKDHIIFYNEIYDILKRLKVNTASTSLFIGLEYKIVSINYDIIYKILPFFCINKNDFYSFLRLLGDRQLSCDNIFSQTF